MKIVENESNRAGFFIKKLSIFLLKIGLDNGGHYTECSKKLKSSSSNTQFFSTPGKTSAQMPEQSVNTSMKREIPIPSYRLVRA